MFKAVASINGKLMPPDRAKISAFDNSLLYAEGLFETFLGVGDRVAFANEHLDRLHRGAKVIGLKIPSSRAQIERWMRSALKAHPAYIKQLRLTVTAGESARWRGKAGKPQVVILVGPHQLPTHPSRLMVSPFRVDQESVFRRIKTISYAIQAAALKIARQKGFDDALMLNEKGYVAEISSANIFWVRKGVVYTPPIDAGCLEGTTREVMLRETRRLKLKLVEKQVTVPQLMTADEIFISSSTRLVIAVSEIADKKKHTFEPGSITERYRTHFLKLVGLAG
ncbi:MAG: aminotransferase class IV, partial [candidate division Zixibacteria bacterium]|nr:aminotransferase class IV [candidate division Zixibacteria bacterium]